MTVSLDEVSEELKRIRQVSIDRFEDIQKQLRELHQKTAAVDERINSLTKQVEDLRKRVGNGHD